jgi:uncharacterized protein
MLASKDSMSGFFHYVLRTTDAAAARVFYAAVLGRDDAEIFPLHEQALARGARPHWLGFLEVDEVDAAVAAMVARGATALGPKWANPAGVEAATVRDSGGALLALAKPSQQATGGSRPEVVWHHLSTLNLDKAKTDYGELFGWHFEAPRDLGDLGIAHPFAWRPGEAEVGSMSDIVGRPDRHPHWLPHLRVTTLAPALDSVQAGGGLFLGPFTLPNGDRVAVCDDPQGAAFALLASPA